VRLATRLATLGFLLGLGCFKLVDPPPDAAPSAGQGATSPPPGPAPAPDALAPQTCEEIRYCIYRCGQNGDCAATCLGGAPPAAVTRYQAVLRCSLDPCPAQELDCRCNSECGYGACLDLVDACAGRNPDRFCSQICR
jgi:hypothetical protein